MGKQKLHVEYDFDFELIAISFHDEDYKLSWLINKQLGLNLGRVEDFELSLKNSEEKASYALYSFLNEENQWQFDLVSNRSEKGFLIPEMKTTDFFLMIKGVMQDEELKEIIEGLKKTPKIQMAYSIDPSKLKSKHNLLF